MEGKQRSQIATFLEQQTIFVTGITGFVGKVLLANLLLACPDITKVYMLIRGRRDKTAQMRFEQEILALEIYEDILRKHPGIKNRLVVRGARSE
jgi:fatty acyl-CoA reductase